MDGPGSNPLNDGNYDVPKKKRPVAVKNASGCRIQKYREKWEEEENFREWLCQAACGSGYCKMCKCLVKPRHSTLLQHCQTAKHAKAQRKFKESDLKIVYVVGADNSMLASSDWVGTSPITSIEFHGEVPYSVAAAPARSTAPPPTVRQIVPKKYLTTKKLKEELFEKKMTLMGLQIKLEQEISEKKKSLLDAELNINLMELEMKKFQYGRPY